MTNKTIDWSDEDLIDEDPEDEQVDNWEFEHNDIYIVKSTKPDEKRFQGNNYTQFFKYGEPHVYHRVGGPAVISGAPEDDNYSEAWYINGKLHRDDGPAETKKNKNRSIKGHPIETTYVYARNDVIMTKEEFEIGEKSSLEAEFLAAVKEAEEKFLPLEQKMEEVSKESRRIETILSNYKDKLGDLAIKLGLQLSADVGFNRMRYTPNNASKFSELDRKIIDQVLCKHYDFKGFATISVPQLGSEKYNKAGWAESSNCKV